MVRFACLLGLTVLAYAAAVTAASPPADLPEPLPDRDPRPALPPAARLHVPGPCYHLALSLN